MKIKNSIMEAKNKDIQKVKNLLDKKDIAYRIINSPGQTPMAQISSYKYSFDLEMALKKLNYKIVNIDSTSLIC